MPAKSRLRSISAHLSQKEPMRVCVTGAGGQIAYSLLPMLCRGLMLGTDQPIHLNLLDIPQAQQQLQGVIMELQDCAFPLLASITGGSDPYTLFKDCDLVVFLGGFPRKAGMERKELIAKNVDIFKKQGQALNEVGSSKTKCVVVANPANTNCLALATNAPNIPKENFTCLTRLDMNRALSQIAEKASTRVYNVSNVVIWGNHSSTQYPDVNQGTIGGQSIRQFMKDDEWLNGEFIKTVQQRGAAVIKARKMSSAMSAASGTVDHVRDWYLGTGSRWVSMGVVSDGSYGVPEGLVFSFPVICENWNWKIIKNIPLDKFSGEKICATAKELTEERKEALGN